jgi:Ca-activated chloride channel homolog
MKFMDPDILYLLWAIFPVAGLMVHGIRQRKMILGLFADPGVYPFILPGFGMKIRWIKSVLILMALILAVFAMAGPQAGFRWEKTLQKGVDIMIALDCSNSMLAQDIKPNRLEQAKREIIDLLRLMKSDRAGLVAFAGQAILQCPLTLDHDTFNIFLRVLTPDYLPVGGTNLAAAIETCYAGFEKGSDTDKAIVLITDGENTAGNGSPEDVEEIAKKMGQEGIKIFTIGVGDPGGAPIPDPAGGFKKDRGNIILSRVDDQGLERIASFTNGRYVRSVAGNMDLDLIYNQDILNNMERKTLTQGKKKVWEKRFQWFLFPCVLLLLMEMMLPLRRKMKKVGLVLVVVLLGLGNQAPAGAVEIFSSHVKKGLSAYGAKSYEQAKTHFIDAQLESPDDPRLYYNIGAAAYMNKEYDQAEKNFVQAVESKDPKIRHNAMYNLANTRYRQGKLDQAIKDYEAILASFPDDKETRENLEFVKKQQVREKEKKEKDSQQDQKDQKDQKDKEKQKNSEQSSKSDQNQDPKNKDPKNKDPENQDPQNQDPENQDQQNQDQQNQDQQNQDQQNQNPGNKNKEDRNQEEKVSGKADPEKNGEQSALLENRLNRLEDKPGMGMMPVIQKQNIERDW